MSASLAINEGVATITMDDGKANAISHTMLDAVEPLLKKAQTEANAIVIAGRPGLFCAGFDRNVVLGATEAEISKFAARGAQFALSIFQCEKPIIAAATGHGLAMGAVLLLAFDYRVGAAGDFKYGLNETQIGLALPEFALVLIRNRIAPTVQSRAAIMAELYDGSGAVAAGFLDDAVEPGSVLDAAQAEAAQLAKLSAGAYGATKLALRLPVIAELSAAFAGGSPIENFNG